MRQYAVLYDSTCNTTSIIARDDTDDPDTWFVLEPSISDRANAIQIKDAMNKNARGT